MQWAPLRLPQGQDGAGTHHGNATPAGNGLAFDRDIPIMKLQIIVADDNNSMLGALVSALSSEFDVIATASDGRSALDSIQRLRPGVAVLDLNMPGLNGIEITREIARLHLASRVVICSIEKDPELIAAAKPDSTSAEPPRGFSSSAILRRCCCPFLGTYFA